MSTLTINNSQLNISGNSFWTIRNNDCGINSNNVTATINSLSINGVQIGNLSGSTFPLTSTLQGTKSNPSGIIYGGSNNIQVNVTAIPIDNTLARLVININQNEVYNQNFSSPFPSANGIIINKGDDIQVIIYCYSV